MIDDFENEIREEIQERSTSDKFKIKEFYHPSLKQDENILCMSTSKKYIYLVSKGSELLLIDSTSLRPIKEKFRIPSADTNKTFKENLTKIWSDRCGNHNIFRYRHAIYYFNPNFPKVKELKNFTNKEISAVSFDDRNNDTKSTKNFLVSDYYNNIYECNISLSIQKYLKGDFEVVDTTRKLIQLTFKDSDEDGDDVKDQNDRIYGIKFFKATKNNLGVNDNARYIIAVTKNRLYQFRGPGEQSFSQLFMRYEKHLDINDSCKYFPTKKKNFRGSDLDILFRSAQRNVRDRTKVLDVMSKFGWKTESGFCFGNFTYDSISCSILDYYIFIMLKYIIVIFKNMLNSPYYSILKPIFLINI